VTWASVNWGLTTSSMPGGHGDPGGAGGSPSAHSPTGWGQGMTAAGASRLSILFTKAGSWGGGECLHANLSGKESYLYCEHRKVDEQTEAQLLGRQLKSKSTFAPRMILLLQKKMEAPWRPLSFPGAPWPRDIHGEVPHGGGGDAVMVVPMGIVIGPVDVGDHRDPLGVQPEHPAQEQKIQEMQQEAREGPAGTTALPH